MAEILGTFYNDELLEGTEANDQIFGFFGTDYLLGAGGDDYLDGGQGADEMIGGLGNDSYRVDDVEDLVVESADEGIDLVYSEIDYVLGDNVENLQLIEPANQEQVSALVSPILILAPRLGTGNDLANIIRGTIGDDSLSGLAGDDTLVGAAGNDTLKGGTGNDVFFVADTGDAVQESPNEGDDLVISFVNHTLAANVENLSLRAPATQGTGNSSANYMWGTNAGDSLVGLAGNDSLAGLAGNDTLNGGAGIDVMYGGPGDDLYFVDNADDLVVEGADGGLDSVRSTADFALRGHVETLQLMGSALNGFGSIYANNLIGNNQNNVFNGLLGNDIILGVGGNDKLFGAGGNDILNGVGGGSIGTGEIDTLVGGVGADSFSLGDATQSYYATGKSTDYALIADFAVGSDRLVLNGSAAEYLIGSPGMPGEVGAGLFLDKNNNGSIEAADDLIAVVRSPVLLTPANLLATASYR